MLVQRALGDAPIQVEEELYAASSDALLERLCAVPDEVGSLLLIGHNPGLYDLALVLASTGSELDRLEAKFPTAGFATLAVPRSPWSRLGAGDAELVAYVVPKQLD